MKNLLKLPALLLAVMLVASCGDSKKEEEKKLSPVEMATADGDKTGQLMCKVTKAANEMDAEELEKVQKEAEEFSKEMEKKYGDKDLSEEVKKAFEKAIRVAIDNCK